MICGITVDLNKADDESLRKSLAMIELADDARGQGTKAPLRTLTDERRQGMSKYKKGDRFWFEITDVIDAGGGKTMYECDNGGYAADGILDGFNVVVQCSDCRHRPIVRADGIDAPTVCGKEADGSITEMEDFTCPFLFADDEWYNGNPPDDFFCKYGER